MQNCSPLRPTSPQNFPVTLIPRSPSLSSIFSCSFATVPGCILPFQILVNNKPADFPASTKNLHAFLIPTIPSAHIKSDYGVHVTCGYKTAMVCTVRVSGFYHGKLRGLLGDGNNEQYDDYMLPSGKVSARPVFYCVLYEYFLAGNPRGQSKNKFHHEERSVAGAFGTPREKSKESLLNEEQ